MDKTTTLQNLLQRLLADEDGSGPETAELPPLSAGESAALEIIGSVFAGYDQLRRQDWAPPAQTPLQAGDPVGAFVLIAPLGSGGMGEVWLARRGDGRVEQKVALKFLHRSRLHAGEGLVREQRLLARLEHPNIARFIDAGVDAGNRAFLAMEFVDGQPIDDYCRERQLGLAPRLALFLQICAAVEHAHGHLVLHRDIKPANILVDGAGRVRLLDFGVGKLLAGDDGSLPTEQPAFTFAYAAPEQFRGAAAAMTTDVFSLGLLLFQLLAGELPRARQSAALIQLAMGIGTLEWPSQQAQKDPQAPLPAAQLRGDLDAIVAKAIDPDPEQRYGTVVALADDLRRYRDGHAVGAREPTRLYRLRKFLRRHRSGAVAAALVLLALIVGLGAALQQTHVARAEARRADLEAAQSARVAAFLAGLFREQDPLQREGVQARSARDLVAEGVLRTRSELAQLPQLRAAMLGLLGEASANLGDMEAGRQLLQEARAAVTADSREAARFDGLLGGIAARQGRQAEGLPLIESAIARLQSGNLDDRIAAARLQARRGDVLYRAGKAEQALADVRAAHALLQSTLGADRLETLDVQVELLVVLDLLRRDDEERALALQVIARIEALAGVDSARLIAPLRMLAGVQRRAGEYDLALRTLDRAIALTRRHLGTPHAMLSTLYSRAAEIYKDQERPEASLALLLQAEEALPPDALAQRTQLLASRGSALLIARRDVEAEATLREVLRLRRASSGEGDSLTWYAQSEWGRALSELQQHVQAERVQLEALQRMEQILGPGAYQITFVLRALADSYRTAGRPAKAVPILQRAVQLTQARYDARHPMVLQYRLNLAYAQIDAGMREQALAELDGMLAGPQPADKGRRDLLAIATKLRDDAVTGLATAWLWGWAWEGGRVRVVH